MKTLVQWMLLVSLTISVLITMIGFVCMPVGRSLFSSNLVAQQDLTEVVTLDTGVLGQTAFTKFKLHSFFYSAIFDSTNARIEIILRAKEDSSVLPKWNLVKGDAISFYNSKLKKGDFSGSNANFNKTLIQKIIDDGKPDEIHGIILDGTIAKEK